MFSVTAWAKSGHKSIEIFILIFWPKNWSKVLVPKVAQSKLSNVFKREENNLTTLGFAHFSLGKKLPFWPKNWWPAKLIFRKIQFFLL